LGALERLGLANAAAVELARIFALTADVAHCECWLPCDSPDT
jgi:hypothetical protein